LLGMDIAPRTRGNAASGRGPKRASRIVLGSLITAIGVGPMIADQLWEPIARQHMRNPAWSPHAKFHDAQYITMSALISAIALRILFQRDGDPHVRLRNAAALSSVSWLGMWGAMLFPGTAATDPEFASEPTERPIVGLPPQLFLSVIGLGGLAATVTVEAVRARHKPSPASD